MWMRFDSSAEMIADLRQNLCYSPCFVPLSRPMISTRLAVGSFVRRSGGDTPLYIVNDGYLKLSLQDGSVDRPRYNVINKGLSPDDKLSKDQLYDLLVEHEYFIRQPYYQQLISIVDPRLPPNMFRLHAEHNNCVPTPERLRMLQQLGATKEVADSTVMPHQTDRKCQAEDKATRRASKKRSSSSIACEWCPAVWPMQQHAREEWCELCA